MSEQSDRTGRTGRTLRTGRIATELGAPVRDLTRSPAAWRVARMAHAAGLFLFDYEQRVQLELPEHWLPPGRDDLGVTGAPPTWERGLLGESKYLAFRHDVLLGSLHAGHRAKWSAHELCHGLVGFAWRPDAGPLFHALAARVAEVLPVALWYFFDEAQLRRCARHRTIGEVGPSYCAACEEAAGVPVEDDAEAASWTRRGLEFVARELGSVRRAIASGRPDYHVHGHIDLMTDGLAYAAAHAERLASMEWQGALLHTFGERAGGAGGAPGRNDVPWFEDLERFMAHIEALTARVAGVAPEDVLEVIDEAAVSRRRARHVAQDLAFRVMQVAADCSGEAHAGLSGLVARLGAAIGAGAVEIEQAIARSIDDYVALHEEFELPPSEHVFAVGYDLPRGLGRSVDMLVDGLDSAMRGTLERLERAHGGNLAHSPVREIVRRFAAETPPSREALPRRFARFLAEHGSPEIGALAALEAVIATVPPPDPAELTLGLDLYVAPDGDVPAPTELRLAHGVELVVAGFDVGGLLMHGQAAPDGPEALLVRRDAADQVGLVAVSRALAARLSAGPIDALAAAREAERDPEMRALLDEGLLVPDRWPLVIE